MTLRRLYAMDISLVEWFRVDLFSSVVQDGQRVHKQHFRIQ